MKNLLLTSLGVLSSFYSFGQLENYDLSKYKLADYKFRALNTSFSLAGATNSQKDNFDRYLKGSFYHFKPALRFSYNGFKSSRKIQEFNFSEFSFLSSIGLKGDDMKRLWSVSSGLEQDYEVRFYDPKERFLGIGTDYSFSFSSGRNNLNQNLSATYREAVYRMNIAVPFSIGIGRVENVTDAWQSVRILNDLKKFGFLKNEPSDKQINNFADFINKRQRLRFFDSRLKRIEDLEELDAYLKGTKVVQNESATYYASLYDMWLYGINSQRLAGKSFSLGISPYYNRSASKIRNENFEPYILYGGLNAFLKYENNNPIDLKWQFNYEAVLNFDSRYDLEANDKPSESFIRPEFNFTVGYFPTSRTEFIASFRNSYSIPFDNGLGFFSEEGFATHLRANLNYYLSPQTRISGYVYLGFFEEERSGVCGYVFSDFQARLIFDSGQGSCNYSNFGIRLAHSFL